MHPLDDDPHETTDPAPDLASLRPLRLFQTVTAVTGALSAAGVGGVLALQSTPGYARAVLEARSWGASEVTDADVAAFLTPAGAWPVAAAAVVVLTLVLLAGITRRIRAVRPVGSVLVVLGMLTAAFWMVDGGRMVQAGEGGRSCWAPSSGCSSPARCGCGWRTGGRRATPSTSELGPPPPPSPPRPHAEARRHAAMPGR